MLALLNFICLRLGYFSLFIGRIKQSIFLLLLVLVIIFLFFFLFFFPVEFFLPVVGFFFFFIVFGVLKVVLVVVFNWLFFFFEGQFGDRYFFYKVGLGDVWLKLNWVDLFLMGRKELRSDNLRGMNSGYIMTGNGLNIDPLSQFEFRLDYFLFERRRRELKLNSVDLRGRERLLRILMWDRLVLYSSGLIRDRLWVNDLSIRVRNLWLMLNIVSLLNLMLFWNLLKFVGRRMLLVDGYIHVGDIRVVMVWLVGQEIELLVGIFVAHFIHLEYRLE